MVRITLDINRSIEQNASVYFEKSKKIKKKLKGAEEAIQLTLIKLDKLRKQHDKETAKEQDLQVNKPSKKEWYEKFRWFISSEGFLVLGGRDATTNEIMIKKHTDSNDLVFHTDMAGSPFFVIKQSTQPNKPIGKATMQETADATCTFSRAFKLGLTKQDVFYVKPEQVTKEANSGEYLSKGAFVIRGKTNYISNKINLAIGLTEDGRIMAAPLECVQKNCSKFITLEQGDKKPSELARLISKKIGGSLDDIIRVLPSGDMKVKG